MKLLTILLICLLPLLITAQVDKNKQAEEVLKSIKFTTKLITFATQEEITQKTGDLKSKLVKSETVLKKEKALEEALVSAKKDQGLFIALVGVAVYDKAFPIASIIKVITAVLEKGDSAVVIEIAELLATFYPGNEATISKALSKAFPSLEKDIIAAVERGIINSGNSEKSEGQGGVTNEGAEGQAVTVIAVNTNTPVIVVPAEDVNQSNNSNDGT